MKNRIIYLALISALVSLPLSAEVESRKDSVTVRPFGITGEQIPGSAFTITSEELEHYTASDLRVRLTGLIPGLEVRQNNGNLSRNSLSINMSGASETLTGRGSSNIICIVDDVPVPFDILLLEPCQIESITYLRDAADKALFGPAASAGALYIRTKNGGYGMNSRTSADFESGIAMTGVWPEWVSGAEYAQLNNQARINSGYTPLYTDQMIEGYKKNDPYSLTTPDVDYKSMLYKTEAPLARFGINTRGGSEQTKYNISLGGLYRDWILKIGDPSDFYKVNLNINAGTHIGRHVEVGVNGLLTMSFNRVMTGETFGDYINTPSIAFPVHLGEAVESIDGVTPYAVSKTFLNNPYAAILEGGSSVFKRRTGMFNLTMNTDLSFILPGLKSRTFVNYFSYLSQQLGKKEDYFAYYWEPGAAPEDLERSAEHTYEKESGKKVLGSASFEGINFYERLSYDITRGKHTINSGLTYYMSNYEQSESGSPQRTQNIIGNIAYNWNDKIFAELVMDCSGSMRFYKKSRFGFFPAMSLGWKPGEKTRIRLNAGILGDYDVFGQNFLYTSQYAQTGTYTTGQSSSNAWFGSTVYKETQSTTIYRLYNHNLTWPTSFNASLGADFSPIDGLSVSIDFWRNRMKGIITECSAVYPDFLGYSATSFYNNYDESVACGADLAVDYARKFGDFRLGVGGWCSLSDIRHTRLANDIYTYDWQKRTGTRTDSYRGFVCLGKFSSREEIESSPLFTADTEVGDLKYDDLNDDGVIDINDQKVIGNTTPKLFYALNLRFGWRKYEISAVGTGRAFYDVPFTSSYFRGGFGDGNYSAFIRDNIGGDYPRLSYDVASNNTALSDFWLRKGGYFKLKNIEIARDFNLGADSPIKNIRVCLRGSNIFTITDLDYVDPENVDAGIYVAPLFRTFTAGVKLNF